MDRIGIVGNGYVGSAVKFGFSPSVGYDADVKVYDIDPNRASHTLDETVNGSQYIFLSVPTPANPDGSVNTDIVESALHNINNAKSVDVSGQVVLLRSTVTPGTTRRLSNMFPDIEMVFNPEFLTERSAHFDFINQARIVLGGSSDDSVGVKAVADLFRRRFGNTISILQTNFESAELVKYMTNTFFATKVSFLNEMKQLSDSSNAVWDDVAEGFVRDGRVGHSHMNIPGPDGKLGFGGSCFPKDIQALISYGESCGVSMNVLRGAWETNLKVRPERDWEQLRGRAVVDE
jgi:nucleotide sugar dehydrogenase|tara:strand:+ start:2463 stop:3332 length:870 start_codon:yes stop_codon:yes gene_type:complete